MKMYYTTQTCDSDIWPQWPRPLALRSIGFLCYPWWMCGPGMRKVGQCD